MNMRMLFFFFCVTLFSTWITSIVRRYTLRNAILDIPNERSSHQIPIPRGGGFAIAFTFFLFLSIFYWKGWLATSFFLALCGGIIIALIGYIDDVKSVKASTRMIIHLIVALWAVYWLGSVAIFPDAFNISFNLVNTLLTVIGIVWCINFYNFMDGIDGLAGCEGIFVALVSGIALTLLGFSPLASLMWLLAATITGFTLWNWPPAKIFLGDIGSGFLGYIFAVFALFTTNQSILPLPFWLVISAVFLYDASFTLVSRLLQRKKWYIAHREHAYQHLTLLGFTHKQVTLSIMIVNISILLPIAYSILFWPSKRIELWLVSTCMLFVIWKGIKLCKVR